MTVTLSLNSEAEKRLMASAIERGVSLNDYLQELVARTAGLPGTASANTVHKRFKNLSDLLLNSPFAGANLDLERSKDQRRPANLE